MRKATKRLTFLGLILLISGLLASACGSQSSSTGSNGDDQHQGPSATTGITNGGFESGLTGWTSAGTTATGAPAHSGAASAKVGASGATGLSSLSQTFTVPAGGGTLSFWYQGFCNDTVKYAWATVTLVDATSNSTTTLLKDTCAKTGQWVQVTSAALTAGHSVTLKLASEGEVYQSDYNYTLYDDVTFNGTSAPGNDFSLALSPSNPAVAQGASVSLTVSTAVVSGSAESIALSVSGLPSGVTGSFNPSSVTAGASSTLTLTASSSAAASTTSFTVSGVAPSASHTAAGSVTVTSSTSPTNDFSLGLSPTSATIAPGGSATYSVSTAVTSGSAQSIALSISGLPSGVTFSLNPASVTAGQSATLTLVAASSAAGASGTFTVTGTAASGSHAATGSITVSTPTSNDFSVALGSSSVTVAQGGSGTVTVDTAVVSGAAQTITLSVSGLPSGVSGAFNPASVTAGASSTLTLTAASNATAASSTFTVTGKATSGSHAVSGTLTVAASGGTGVGNSGGTVDHLFFGVVGDSRPADIDDITNYPTAIISKIYQEMQAMSPKPEFVLTTGDYMYANTNTSTAQPQVNLYVGARNAFTGTVFATMGNHECDGYTADNCTSLTQTDNIKAFMGSLVTPLGKSLPYYAININAIDGSWTAKLINVACNYWSSTQQTWLTQQLATATTYTILSRHMPAASSTGPCVTEVESLMKQYPYDLSLVGHTHEFKASDSSKEIIVGNGGAPLTGSGSYGYATVERLSTGWQIKQYDYSSGLPINTYLIP